MRIASVDRVYFVGAGGIGMSALARYFLLMKKSVAGYDRARTQLTDSLIEEGVEIHYEDDICKIPQEYCNPEGTLVVYTPAISLNNSELSYFSNGGFVLKNRAEVLGMVTKSSKGIAVAGTHGKTTTSTLIAHLLKSGNVPASAFLGGISRNINSNFYFSDHEEYVVVEADEYVRSFLQLTPWLSIITSIDPDHLDIYGAFDEIKRSFNLFVKQTDNSGLVIVNQRVRQLLESSGVKMMTYGLESSANYYARDIQVSDGKYSFIFEGPDITIENLEMGLPGRFNVENAVAAVAAAIHAGSSPKLIKSALKSFKGSKRRFETILSTNNHVYIDDYAHHPEELKACISAAVEMFPGKRIAGIFQPHLFSRTKDFYKEFARELSKLDLVYLLDIYPAREMPIPGISSSIIFDEIVDAQKVMCSRENILDVLDKSKFDVLLSIGAGNIDTIVEPITKFLDS
ncbi:MAG: UDP-N-acetylmuramate--L-alanine ligase [Marinilabiliales bacterium]|nr:MAG: UDP-N-acetylmuramate--L-alanine ligase [Marinilabiliales bacterium]